MKNYRSDLLLGFSLSLIYLIIFVVLDIELVGTKFLVDFNGGVGIFLFIATHLGISIIFFLAYTLSPWYKKLHTKVDGGVAVLSFTAFLVGIALSFLALILLATFIAP